MNSSLLIMEALALLVITSAALLPSICGYIWRKDT